MHRLLSHPFVRTHLSQGLKFAMAGGLGACIDLGSLTLFVEYFALPSRLAVIPSTLLAVSAVFLINKHFTFHNREHRYGRQILRFAFVYGVAICSNIGISALLITLGVHYLPSKIAAIGLGALWNYGMSHGYVFKKKVDPVDAAMV